MVAAPTHLQKLDRIQAAAERLGNFKVESLQSRRDASLIGLKVSVATLVVGFGFCCLRLLVVCFGCGYLSFYAVFAERLKWHRVQDGSSK